MAGGTRDFAVNGSSVSGTGDTPSSGSDHFYGSAGAGYTVSVAPGASLFSRFAIRRGETPGPGTIGRPTAS